MLSTCEKVCEHYQSRFGNTVFDKKVLDFLRRDIEQTGGRMRLVVGEKNAGTYVIILFHLVNMESDQENEMSSSRLLRQDEEGYKWPPSYWIFPDVIINIIWPTSP